MRRFNVTGACFPEQHYMVHLDNRLAEITTYIERGDYLVIHRGRQYGKTTTLRALARYLAPQYIVVSLDFERISSAVFRDEAMFSATLAQLIAMKLKGVQLPHAAQAVLQRLQTAGERPLNLFSLFLLLSELCGASDRPMVLIVDEVDQASNNQVFLDFLGQLRSYYLSRIETPTFQSVILAGVRDIRSLQLKIRPNEAHMHNSPWNIAAEFTVDLSFSAADIAGMLRDYEQDHHTGMDVSAVAQWIYDYTSGYPVMVSQICKSIDESSTNAGAAAVSSSSSVPAVFAASDASTALQWNRAGVAQAAGQLVLSQAPLFQSLENKLEESAELREQLANVLFSGAKLEYDPTNEAVRQALMYGFVKIEDHSVQIANRIFETRFYNSYLLSAEMKKSDIFREGSQVKSQFVRGAQLDMIAILQKFVVAFSDIYGNRPKPFLEEEGRKIFLLYLRPIINGAGNYYIEARTRDNCRTDIILDYHGKQYIIELKIWRGEEYNRRGEQQLAAYLDAYHQDTGYLVSFNFNEKKETGVHTRLVDGKTIIEAVV